VILVRDDKQGQELVSQKRRRQIRLIYDLLLNIATFLFGLAGLAFLAYSYLTPGLRDKPFDTSLEGVIGHAGTFIFFLIFSLIILLAGVFFGLKTLRLMRNKAYIEAEEPPFADYR
jgi:hypothetical protein